MTDPNVQRIQASVAAWEEVEQYVSGRAKDARGALDAALLVQSAAQESDRAAQLESQLEGLAWVEAASKKCDFVRNAPSELVGAVRSIKGGVKGERHHFTASNGEPTLFRFKRSSRS